MSIDERLRSGLAANTEHLVPDLELELSRVLRKAYRRRRQALVVGATLVAAAVVAAVAWLGGIPGLERATGPHDPIKSPKVKVLTPKSMAGIDGPLEAGRWIVPMWGKDPDSLPRAVVEVPEGYGSPGGWVVDRGADGDPEKYGSVGFWSVQGVVRDPCEGVTTFDPGPGVRDLARALGALPGVTTTAPTRVTVDGHPGRYLEVSFPKDQSQLTGCHESAIQLWRTDAGDYYGGDIAGTVSRLWILDVDGTRVVMAADTTPREDAAATAEVLGIAASAHFLEPLKPRPARRLTYAGPGLDYVRRGAELVPLEGRDFTPGRPTASFVTNQGGRLRLRLGDDVATARTLHVFQWLDDDAVALWEGKAATVPAPWGSRATVTHPGLVTCSLSSGDCVRAVAGSHVDVVPGLPGRNA